MSTSMGDGGTGEDELMDAEERRRRIGLLRAELGELRQKLGEVEGAREYEEILSQIAWVSHRLKDMGVAKDQGAA